VTLLVTGAAGFLGTAVVERLLAHGYTDIRCNVRRQADIVKLDALSRRYAHSRLEYCVGNLKYRDDAARTVDGAQLIFHLAAGKKGAAADLFLDTVVASRNLLDAVADRKPMRIVLVSSFAVYGVAGLRPGAQVNEQTVLEPHPEWRDHYSHTKLRQEQLFWKYQQRSGFELVVLRPGVVYGPTGGHFSNRGGLMIGKWQLHFGGSNLLPLTYVENCAEAVVFAGTHQHAAGQVYNVHDDDLPTCREYLRAYKKYVGKIRSISVPYFGVQLLSALLAKYHRYSKGQLPAILTPYKAASLWGGNRFDNYKLRSIGWRPLVSTAEGLRRSFAAFRSELDTATVRKQILPMVMTNPVEGSTGEFRRSPDEFVVGAVLDGESNGSFDHLLAAVSSLHKTGRCGRLVMFGNHDAQQLATAGANQGLGVDIQCLRGQLNTRASLQACDVLVSLQEGIPSLVLQAMSSRIPVITTAIRVPEVIQHQRTAICIRNGDENSLQEALLQLFEQPKRRLILGAVAHECVTRQYSDANLWATYYSHDASEHELKGRALIKRGLFSAVPRQQLIEHGNRNRAQIALTIDDGPDPIYTPRILDIFRDYGIKTTFFVVGGCAEQYRNILIRIKEEGHEVGNHSYSHPYFHRLSWRGATQEIRMTCTVLNRILGKKCRLFRPPFGKLSLRSLVPAWAAGQHVVMWNVDLKDYCAQAGAVEAKLARTPLSSGDIILYHGVSEAALKALPRVIEAALDGERRAVTISELIRP
jgi:nucleoside-diphosphate-sugar epimerase/peptidoglycan/xylan/chitin deacetylase (PgdA/CDA1 family)